ncbi:hypothetical protein D349_01642 [Enterococcus faecalis UP2S-6]|nr:hypothetical protein D349_01642 [Enterococcus faecalis UP2S-6]
MCLCFICIIKLTISLENNRRSGQKRLTPRNKKEFPKIVL